MFIKFIPKPIKALLRKYFSWEKWDLANRIKNNPYYGDPDELIFPNSKHCIGIIEDDYQYHQFYIEACRKLEVSYKLINIVKEDWISRFTQADCDGYLVWPSIRNTVIKELFDDRLTYLSKYTNQIFLPSLEECLIYENKLRMAYWLRMNNIKHPRTWIFYYKHEAINFSQSCSLPIVFKSSFGATASGVKIVKNRRDLYRLVHKIFRDGFLPRGHNKYDKQRGFIIFQEFINEVREWRMVRIGDAFFGYEKLKKGDFHSGSHNISLHPPSHEMLDLLKHITDLGGFRSMDVDVFLDLEGKLYVNELQTVFGTEGLKASVKLNPHMAKGYKYENNSWVEFDGYEDMVNGFASLRVKELVKQIDNFIEG